MADTQVVEEKKDEKQTLTDSISAAVETHDKDIGGDTASDTQETKEKAEPSAKTDKYGLTELEQEQATQLFAALKNPDERGVVIDFMARNSGYAKIDTPAKAEEVKENISDTLKKALGPELDYLADKLGPVIDKVIDDKLRLNTKDIRDKLEINETEKLNQEAAAAMGRLAQKVFKAEELPDQVLVEMNKLMDKMPPSADMTVAEYIENIYYSVAGRLDIKPTNKDQEDRRSRNRNDAPGRLASGGTRAPVPGNEVAKSMSLTDAISKAIEAVNEQENK